MTRRTLLPIIVTVLIVIGYLLASYVFAGPGNSDAALEHAKQVQQKHTEKLMAIKGVEGTAVARTVRGIPAVAVLLEKPGVRGVPKELEGVPIKPIVTGKFYARVKPPGPPGQDKDKTRPDESIDPTSRFERPVPIGVSTGHPDITAGTIACRVTKDDKVYALSNNHVYADENRATIGDAVTQPGAYDGGALPDDFLGTLAEFEPINFSFFEFNLIDAAIVECTTDDLGNATPADGYGVPKIIPLSPQVGMGVMKYGRTTKLTKGKIVAINAILNVQYDTGVATFTGQMIISPASFSAPGDSGSLIVVEKANNARRPVGLLFAGSPSFTVANPAGAVFDAFGVIIDDD